MDFTIPQEQQDIRQLARKIFADLAPAEKLPSFEEPQDWFDERLWRSLAETGLLGVALPEAVGGMGLGFMELCALLEEAGHACAPAPLWSTLVLGAAPLAHFGGDRLHQNVLRSVVAGKTLLTAALVEEGNLNPQAPATRAQTRHDGWVLRGTKSFVPAARSAAWIIVSATMQKNNVGLFLVERDAPGLTYEPQATTTGEYEYRLSFDDVVVEAPHVLTTEANAAAWIVDRAVAALCAIELGAAERALRMTAEYTANRKQFGKPIATFQAVAQRAADAYIDLEAIRLTTWQAAWRLARDERAPREVAIAKFWASEAGHRICYAAQHLHGGIGVDTDYPLHHYYLLSKKIELTFGGAAYQLGALGRMLAAEEALPEGDISAPSSRREPTET